MYLKDLFIFMKIRKINLESIEKLYEYKILRDVIDLFGLIYSREFISEKIRVLIHLGVILFICTEKKCQE